MAAVRDLYEILGVARDASPTEIKAAYRKLARTLHPDVNADPADQERFKEITGAYEILSDPAKRRRYDEFGAAGPQGAPFGDIQDLFDMFFGGGFGVRSRGPRSRVQRGEDLRIRVRLTFPESVFGTQQELEIERLAACAHVRWDRRAPGNVARHVPDVSWGRRGPERSAEHLRDGHDGGPVRGLWRDGPGDPGPVRRVRWRRSRCARAPR